MKFRIEKRYIDENFNLTKEEIIEEKEFEATAKAFDFVVEDAAKEGYKYDLYSSSLLNDSFDKEIGFHVELFNENENSIEYFVYNK